MASCAHKYPCSRVLGGPRGQELAQVQVNVAHTTWVAWKVATAQPFLHSSIFWPVVCSAEKEWATLSDGLTQCADGGSDQSHACVLGSTGGEWLWLRLPLGGSATLGLPSGSGPAGNITRPGASRGTGSRTRLSQVASGKPRAVSFFITTDATGLRLVCVG